MQNKNSQLEYYKFLSHNQIHHEFPQYILYYSKIQIGWRRSKHFLSEPLMSILKYLLLQNYCLQLIDLWNKRYSICTIIFFNPKRPIWLISEIVYDTNFTIWTPYSSIDFTILQVLRLFKLNSKTLKIFNFWFNANIKKGLLKDSAKTKKSNISSCINDIHTQSISLQKFSLYALTGRYF
jgi:hypothetical protein